MQLLTPRTENKAYPPKGFKGVKGCSWVKTCEAPQFARDTKGNTKGSKRKGILYEAKVVKKLEDEYPDWVGVSGLWFHFSDFYGERYAQADWLGINMKEGRLCLVEIKLSRVSKAWWQLNRLYLPLVKRLFPDWDVSLLEITSNIYNVPTPEPVKIAHTLPAAPIGQTSVMRIAA